MNELPLVSICIPNYNNAKYLDMCIKSAINQSYKNIEIIFVDDCSSDNSLEIAKRYKDNIKIIINGVNLGQPKNTNKCVSYSNGKYCVILHSDDYLLPHFAEKLVDILERYPTVGIVIGERIEIDEFNVRTEITPFYTVDCIIPGEKQAKVFMMAAVLPCQVLFRRKLFKLIGGADERYVMNLDGLLWFKCSLFMDVGYIQTPVSAYRKHSDSATYKYGQSIDLIIEHYLTIVEMIKISKGNYYLEKFFADAIKRVGYLALRYSSYAFKSKNFKLAKQYLTLATVFDSNIVNNYLYYELMHCLISENVEIYENLLISMSRTFSYTPPEGYVLM